MAKDNHGSCPACGADWNGGGIWLHFYDEELRKQLALGTMNVEAAALATVEADRVAACYGATRTTGCWGRQIGLSDGDGVYAWQCPDCEHEVVFNAARKARFQKFLGAAGETPAASTKQ